MACGFKGIFKWISNFNGISMNLWMGFLDYGMKVCGRCRWI